MARMPNAKEVMARVWAEEHGLAVPVVEDVSNADNDNDNGSNDTIMPGHIPQDTQEELPQDNTEQEDDLNNPVISYINELIIDLVSKNHVRIMNMNVIRCVFRSVLLKLCDAAPHTFSEIRSAITPNRRQFVKQVITRLQKHNLVVEIELNNRLFYRANLDEVGKIRAYIVATESIK